MTAADHEHDEDFATLMNPLLWTHPGRCNLLRKNSTGWEEGHMVSDQPLVVVTDAVIHVAFNPLMGITMVRVRAGINHDIESGKVALRSEYQSYEELLEDHWSVDTGRSGLRWAGIWRVLARLLLKRRT
jgi:hypothetical protein